MSDTHDLCMIQQFYHEMILYTANTISPEITHGIYHIKKFENFQNTLEDIKLNLQVLKLRVHKISHKRQAQSIHNALLKIPLYNL